MLTPAISASSTSLPCVIIANAVSTQVLSPPFLNWWPLADAMTTGCAGAVVIAGAWPAGGGCGATAAGAERGPRRPPRRALRCWSTTNSRRCDSVWTWRSSQGSSADSAQCLRRRARSDCTGKASGDYDCRSVRRHSGMPRSISLDTIRDAARTVYRAAVRTPLVPLGRLDAGGPEIFLKLETLQPIGSFKIRGA